MGRAILAVIFGLLVGGITIGAVEALGHALVPPPEFDPDDPAAVREMIRNLPPAAFGFVLAAWFCGTFCAAWTATLIAARENPWPAFIVAGCFQACGIAMLFMIPSPWWFNLLALTVFFPAAFAGRRTGLYGRSAK